MQVAFGKASRDLNLSQSAITKSIQMLEAELDTKLLHGASHGVSTTASGEALVARAGIIESELKMPGMILRALKARSPGMCAYVSPRRPSIWFPRRS